MRPQTAYENKHHILYDADTVGEVSPLFFDPCWYEKSGALRGQATGRGTTYFVTLGELPAVLRHYRRGGLIARFSEDCYLNTGLSRSRPWREWHLLASLFERRLPVPQPLAAGVRPVGIGYRADLITREIPDSKPLSNWLQRSPLSHASWRSIGTTIRRFHSQGVYHADLNAHNILLDQEGRIFVIDFDRGRIRNAAEAWQQGNLARLRRSLEKLHDLEARFHFNATDWMQLMAGYAAE